jgi:ribosomal protein S27AE
MQQLNDEQKQKIIELLQKRKARKRCPRCGNKNFALLDGYFNQPIQKTIPVTITDIVNNGAFISSVVVVCTRCGYLSQHALGVLGLLPAEEAQPKDEGAGEQ